MKKAVITLFAVVMAVVLSGNCLLKEKKDFNTKIYYVDHSILRLIPVDYEIENKTTQKACEEVLDKIIEGQDYNRKIMRVVPDMENEIKVKLSKRTAYVDLSEKFMEKIPDNNIHEVLMVYSIVNSLTSVKGVDMVKFRFSGEERKFDIGGMDMRESFIPDYSI